MSYAQTSYPQVPLGDGQCGESIATAGCYITTDAMIRTWMGHPIDPPGVNAAYLAKGLFVDHCLISSDTIARCWPDEVALEREADFPGAADLRLVDNTPDGLYVALKIMYPHGLQGDHPHFLPVYSYKAGDPPSTLQVVDSWDGQIKPLSRYGDPATIITSVMRYRDLRGTPATPPPAPGPTPNPPPAPPQPPPAVPFTGDPKVLTGRWCWEFTDQADYVVLRGLGFDGVLIRATNGDTTGTPAATQLKAWKIRSALARAAGLKAVAWTYWYGPGEPGYTETDPAAYLLSCARGTAALGLDTPGWVIDAEAHELSGLAPALAVLRQLTGKAVFLCPPGDPNQYGFKVDWPQVDSAVDGYVPQFYTAAWGQAVSLDTALAEWTPVPPLYPASDEEDPGRILTWLTAVKAKALSGFSYWRSGVGSADTLRTYATGTLPVPPVIPPTTHTYSFTATTGDGLYQVLSFPGGPVTDLTQAKGLADAYTKDHPGQGCFVRDETGLVVYTAAVAGPPPISIPSSLLTQLRDLVLAIWKALTK